MDICGFGTRLAAARWDLCAHQSKDLVKALGETYDHLCSPMLTDYRDEPSERVIILNDGIGRTVDLPHPKVIDRIRLVRYIRDILIKHFILVSQLTTQGLGFRTVLAGGQRVQYSPERVTGRSVLFYMSPPDRLARGFLRQEFLYHPAQFQMNTGFSRAYLIESGGSKRGIFPNRFYIDQTWLDLAEVAVPGTLNITSEGRVGHIKFAWDGRTRLEIVFDQKLSLLLKGMNCTVFQVESFTTHEASGREITHFPLNPKELGSDGRWYPSEIKSAR